MTQERVSLIEGRHPIILVAPHGYHGNDYNTDFIVENLASKFDMYAVINRGFERADHPDSENDKADCNNFMQIVADPVVYDEFLTPIVRYKNRILRKVQRCHLFFIHGMANRHVGDKLADIVVGYGAGKPASHSCELWMKNLFCYLLSKASLNVFEGKEGGAFSGWARGNMNQLFRKHLPEPRCHSMQVELARDLRYDKDMAIDTVASLAPAMLELLNYSTWSGPQGFTIQRV